MAFKFVGSSSSLFLSIFKGLVELILGCKYRCRLKVKKGERTEKYCQQFPCEHREVNGINNSSTFFSYIIIERILVSIIPKGVLLKYVFCLLASSLIRPPRHLLWEAQKCQGSCSFCQAGAPFQLSGRKCGFVELPNCFLWGLKP